MPVKGGRVNTLSYKNFVKEVSEICFHEEEVIKDVFAASSIVLGRLKVKQWLKIPRLGTFYMRYIKGKKMPNIRKTSEWIVGKDSIRLDFHPADNLRVYLDEPIPELAKDASVKRYVPKPKAP